MKWPCFYGIDFATRDELVAGRCSVDEICAAILGASPDTENATSRPLRLTPSQAAE